MNVGLIILIIIMAVCVPLLLRRFFGNPKWAVKLPEYMRPTPDQIVRLESIRQQIQESHKAFFLFIVGHPATTRKVQHYHYAEFKRQQPEWSHSQILEAVIRSRWSAGIANGYDLFGLGDYTPVEMENRIKEIANQAGSVDGLANLFIEAEGVNETPPLPGFKRARLKIDRILNDSGMKSVKTSSPVRNNVTKSQRKSSKSTTERHSNEGAETQHQLRTTDAQGKQRRTPMNK